MAQAQQDEASAPATSAQDLPTRAFTGDDVFRLSGATDPQISPDGSMIAYTRITGDIMTDRFAPSIWLVDVRTGEQRPLAASNGAHYSPRWSPDGKRVAYFSTDGSSGAQLHVAWVASGESLRVTSMADSPSSLAWSPDGRMIAYTMLVSDSGPKLGKAPAKPEGAEWAKPLQIVDRVTWKRDGQGYLKPGFSQAFVVPADGGSARRVTSGEWDASGPLSWTDNFTLLFAGLREENWQLEALESEIYAVDTRNGFITALTDRKGPDMMPVASPDGRRIAYLGFDDVGNSYENAELYVMDRDGSNKRALTASFDRSIQGLQWAGNNALYVSYDDEADIKVARVSMDGSRRVVAEGLKPGRIADRPYTGGDFSISDGGTLAFTAGDITSPADLFVKSGGNARRLTALNANVMAAKDIAATRKLTVTAPDGRDVPAWIVEPVGRMPGERVPLILEIHGGPNTAYGPLFATDMQLYAAAGYAVLFTNPRGSTSYGEEFAQLIEKNYPGPDYDDLIAAVDAAIADGVADPDNLFVTGGSGGGVLTSWIVGKTDRFAAAATQKPVINWTSEALTADLAVYATRYWFDALPWEAPMEYWRRSPLSLVGNVTTPTLVVVGEKDYRTPLSESEQYYTALQLEGVDTALVTVPDASHSFTARPSQSAAKASAIIAWFDRYRDKPPVDGDNRDIRTMTEDSGSQ